MKHLIIKCFISFLITIKSSAFLLPASHHIAYRLYRPFRYSQSRFCLNMSDDISDNEYLSYLDKIARQNNKNPQVPHIQPVNNTDSSSSSLSSTSTDINKGNKKKNIERLSSIRNHITKYLDEKQKKENQTESFKSTFINNPIVPIDFDKLFLNINNIHTIYMSSDYDRAVFHMKDNKRFIYKIKKTDDKLLIEKIIKFIDYPVKIKVICDKSIFTDKFGFLYFPY